MRDLSAASSDAADQSASLVLCTLVAVFVSAGILAPAAVLCGACFGRKTSDKQHGVSTSRLDAAQPEHAVPVPLGGVTTYPPVPANVGWGVPYPYNQLEQNGGAHQQYPPPTAQPQSSDQLRLPQHAQMGQNLHASVSRAGGTVLEVRDSSLRAVEELLNNVCSIMGGSIRPGKTLKQSSIRVGINAVIADIASTSSVGETAMFFAVDKFKQRHMNMYQLQSLRDSMPLVTMDVDGYVHRESGHTAKLPACIFVDRANTLSSVINSRPSPQAKQVELFSIWQYLAKQLYMFHSKGRYLRDVTFDNVVKVSMGNSQGWSLLEFARVAKDKRDIEKSSIPARTIPPELAKQMLSDQNSSVRLSQAYDMWQLGILVYEALADQPYWSSHMSDLAILHYMADPRNDLPHEQRPVSLDFVHQILKKLMHRDPEYRFSSADLIARLEQDLATAGVVTLNKSEGDVQAQAPTVLD